LRYAGSAFKFRWHTLESSTLIFKYFSACWRWRLMVSFLMMAVMGGSAFAVTCPVVPAHAPTEAEEAFLHSDFDRAATLYQEQLQQRLEDPALTASLARTFLRQQKVKEADDVIQKALVKNPRSVILLTSQGEVQYREGTPWLAGDTAAAAMKIDPCYPELRLLNARLLRLSSAYASSAKEINTAHVLSPQDPQISRLWLETLPLQERIAALEAYLSSGRGDDPETMKGLHFYLDYLKRQAVEPHKACRLVSNTETATVPFAAMMTDATHIRAFGLDVKFNNHNARLEIDTGASGLVISRSVADRAGLKLFSHADVGGIGSQGRKAAYTAFADDIQIGSLEFRDCAVDVVDSRNVVDDDGLIGMDVFSNFLVTLDYPMRKLLLGPLPQRPDEAAPAKPVLETASGQSEENSSANPAAEHTTAPAAVQRGLHDRYVAPEMKDWTRIYRSGHFLLIPASLNSSKLKMFVLDTGAFSTTISPEVAREVTKVHADDYIQVKGLSGKVDKVFTADSITFRFANVSQEIHDVVAFATPSISRSADMEISGFIGITALGQMTVSIDYRDGLMKFAYDPNRGFRYGR
jgi:predicted aspartyl protease